MIALAVAVVMGGGAVLGYRDAVRQERRIMKHLGKTSSDRLRQHADRLCREIDDPERTVERAVEDADPQDMERVREAGFVWRTTGSDGGESSGDAEAATVGAIASLLGLLGTWWARLLVLFGALALLLLVVLSGTHPDPRFGRVLTAEHRAEQIRLMRAKFEELGRSEAQMDRVEAEIIKRFPTEEEIGR